MSAEFPFATKIVSPLKCIEKPWDLWVSEIGHLSPRRDDDAMGFPSSATDSRGHAVVRRPHEVHPYKSTERIQKVYRRAGVNRLQYESMSLHGLFPQMDNLNAAVCHMCGITVKCSAAYRHLLESHTGAEPILPPPPPTVKLKSNLSRSRLKKDPLPPLPVDIHPIKLETSPVHTAAAPISRIVLPQPDLQYLEEASTSSAITGEVQVSMESGELPVVSIQDTEELPLGENITDDIFAIMNSEGIQSADDITNAADWKNIIRDIGNMQEINFPSTADSIQSQDLYSTVDTSFSNYTLADSDLSNLQFPPNASPLLSTVIDNNVLNAQALKQTPTTPSTKTSRKSSKTKANNQREYDPNKHCGVVTAENPKPCTRSLTCKAHALSLRRTVDGRSKPFDTLLAEHRASREAAAVGAPLASPASLPPLLVNSSLDLGSFNGLTAEQQVNDIYASLLSVEDPMLPDTSGITSLLSQPLSDPFLLPDDAEPAPDATPLVPHRTREIPPVPATSTASSSAPSLVPGDVCWYATSPRPLALCTFNTSHAGGVITLGKKFATVRNNIKTSLSRSSKATCASNNYYAQGMSLSKTLHMNNANKTNKPEVRKLIVTCSAPGVQREMQQTLSDLFGPDVRHTLNGHMGHPSHIGLGRSTRTTLKSAKRASVAALDLGFPLDPLLADEKC
ncbi:ataxin-7-like protein 1 [Danaus plexippus]|uniref:Ataxin-7 protein 1 n=1 Tax=Danaus plexippus plexippus TaxID=278856 RepID=A0A212FMU4_DANPL|nr:ataxin-7-like protein 1 [Danaus plexippus]OWR55061.1 Ataxin-7 protein 1 [Danaus plexippus plexippus]